MGRPPQLTDDYQSATPSPTLPTAVTAWVALQPTAPPPSPANDPGVCDDDGVGPLTPRSCGVEELEPPKSRPKSTSARVAAVCGRVLGYRCWCCPPCWWRLPLVVRLIAFWSLAIAVILFAYLLAVKITFQAPCTSSQSVRVRAIGTSNGLRTTNSGGPAPRELDSSSLLTNAPSSAAFARPTYLTRRASSPEGRATPTPSPLPDEEEEEEAWLGSSGGNSSFLEPLVKAALHTVADYALWGRDGRLPRGATSAANDSLPPLLLPLPALTDVAGLLNGVGLLDGSRVLSAIRLVNDSLSHTDIEMNLTVINRNWFPLVVELSPFRLYYPNSSATGGVLVGQTPPLKHQRLPPYSSTNISLPMTISFPDKSRVLSDVIVQYGLLHFEFLGEAGGRLDLLALLPKAGVKQPVACMGVLDLLGQNTTHRCTPPPKPCPRL